MNKERYLLVEGLVMKI